MTSFARYSDCWFLVALGLSVTDTGSAEPRLASDAERPAGAVSARAEDLFRAGLEALKNDDYEAAAHQFEQSLAAKPSFSARFNLANAYAALGRCTDSEAEFRELARARVAPGAPAWSQEVDEQSTLDRCFAELRLDTVPEDARVSLDGGAFAPRGHIRLDPGRHHLLVTAPGFSTHGRSLTLSRGDRRQLTIRLDALVSAPPPPAESSGLAAEANAPAPVVGAAGADAAQSDVASAERFAWAKWLSSSVAAAGTVTTIVLWQVTADEHDAHQERTASYNESVAGPDPDRAALGQEARAIEALGENVSDLKVALVTSAVVTTVALGVASWLWLDPEDEGETSSWTPGTLRF